MTGLNGRRGVWAGVILLLVAACAAGGRAEMLFIDIGDGTELTFLISGTDDEPPTGLTTFGPLLQTLRFSGIDLQIVDHQADLVENGAAASDEQKAYYQKNAQGLFTVSDGNANNSDEWFEYYTDPRPLFTTDDLGVGEKVEYEGDWRGQWDNGAGMFTAWTGTWELDITFVGPELVQTPLGVFAANHFRTEEHNTQTPDGVHLNVSVLTEEWWIVPGLGLVKLSGDYVSEMDFDGDGTLDETDIETDLWYGVNFGQQALPDVTPTPMKPMYDSSGVATAQAVDDALMQVTGSTQSFPLSSEPGDNGVGFLGGLTTMDDVAVQTLVQALKDDGASDAEAFVHLVIGYDDAQLASLGIDEADLAPYWWDEDDDRWVLVGTTIDGEVGAGMKATLAEHMNHVGYYGLDTVSNEVWLNVNHASLYGVGIELPEPGSLALLVAGGVVLPGRRGRCDRER